MAGAREADLILSPDKLLLGDYYDYGVEATTVDFLVECHTKLRTETASILHLTTNLKAILKSKSLFMSGGGLGGCVYGVPLYKDGSIHNLGDYITRSELPMFLKNQQRSEPIEGVILTPDNTRYGYVDYLNFGTTYLNIYRSSASLMDDISVSRLDQVYDKQSKLVQLLYNVLDGSGSLGDKVYASYETSQQSLLVRMLYFEVVLEYVFLLQADQHAQSSRTRYELYNAHAKDLIFTLNPQLATRFSLANFTSSPPQIDEYLKRKARQGEIIISYDTEQFFAYLAKRLKAYMQMYLLNDTNNFKGHVLFRYFDKRKELETGLARRLWREAEAGGYTILTYRLPKGEIGVVPCAVSAFVGILEDQRWMRGAQIELTLARELATKHSIMRNPYDKTK